MQRVLGLALAAFSLALTMPATAETASQVFQKVSPSIVVVFTYDGADKTTEQGSGVTLPNQWGGDQLPRAEGRHSVSRSLPRQGLSGAIGQERLGSRRLFAQCAKPACAAGRAG